MLHKVKTLAGFTLHALDGEIGSVKELFFDDKHWTIRYLVVETGDWLTGRQVLISPYALGALNDNEKHISINLTKTQIEGSPLLEMHKPVSRQFEESYYGYYGWPMYSEGPYMWGAYPTITHEHDTRTKHVRGETRWDPNLQSTNDVAGYHIQASDGEIGHVEDFIIDEDTWAIRYLVVNTRNWWPGKSLLVSSKWIERVDWNESKVFISLSRDAIKQAPEYSDASLITRDYEADLHNHYKQEGYWAHDLALKSHTVTN